MKRFQGCIKATLFFLLMLLVFILMNRREVKQEIAPTSTPVPTFTSIPTETPFILPTVTNQPPVVIVITEVSVVSVPNNSSMNDVFFTATVCENVPVFSQPATNFNLIIGKLYKGNRIEVTGQSEFWSRISYFTSGLIGYVPTEYVMC